MTNKTYNIIKIATTIVLPALGTAYGIIGATWGLPYTEQVVTTVSALTAAGAAVLVGLSNNYHKNENGEFEENEVSE